MGGTRARLFALVFGALYLLGGVVGFFPPTPFLGTFEVNVAHDVLRIAVGAFTPGVRFARDRRPD